MARAASDVWYATCAGCDMTVRRVLSSFFCPLLVTIGACSSDETLDDVGPGDVGPGDVGPGDVAKNADGGNSNADAKAVTDADASSVTADSSGGGDGNGGSPDTGPDTGDPDSSPVGPGLGGFEGFGRDVTGGAGAATVTVTNLNSSGPGSLREALAGSNRIIQFSVAGTVTLTSTLTAGGANVTIDGFSAPAPGITIQGAALEIHGNSGGVNSQGSNIIVQGLRFRDIADDSVRIAYNAHDIVVDHCSVSAPTTGGDGAIDVTEGAYNVTISHSVLDYSNSSDGPGASLLSYNSSRVSFHHNIFFGSKDRNPILTCNYTQNYSTGSPHTDILADVRYNIVWKYGIGTYILSSGTCIGAANVVANLYKNDGTTNPADVVVRAAYGSAARANAFVAGNVAVHDPRGCAYSYGNSPCYNFPSTNSQNNHAEFAAPAITGPSASDQQGRLDAWLMVRNNAGVISKYTDDPADAAVRSAITIPDVSIFTKAWSD